jgi:hypothetical protein
MARPEVTGKKMSADKPTASAEVDACSIAEFCRRHGISVAHYYKLRARGLTPDEMRAGDRILISKESAARWRKQREKDAAAVV